MFNPIMIVFGGDCINISRTMCLPQLQALLATQIYSTQAMLTIKKLRNQPYVYVWAMYIYTQIYTQLYRHT